jgi:hypothetical protein
LYWPGVASGRTRCNFWATRRAPAPQRSSEPDVTTRARISCYSYPTMSAAPRLVDDLLQRVSGRRMNDARVGTALRFRRACARAFSPCSFHHSLPISLVQGSTSWQLSRRSTSAPGQTPAAALASCRDSPAGLQRASSAPGGRSVPPARWAASAGDDCTLLLLRSVPRKRSRPSGGNSPRTRESRGRSGVRPRQATKVSPARDSAAFPQSGFPA